MVSALTYDPPHLPMEVVLHIFSFCDAKTLAAVRGTCTDLCARYTSKVFTRVLLIPHPAALQDFIDFFSTSHIRHYVRQLDVDARWCQPVQRVLDSLCKLKLRAEMPAGSITALKVAEVLSHLPKLVHVRVYRVENTDSLVTPKSSSSYYFSLLRQLILKRGYMDAGERNNVSHTYSEEALFIGMDAACQQMRNLELLGGDLSQYGTWNAAASVSNILSRLNHLNLDYSATNWDSHLAQVPSSMITWAPNSKLTHLRLRFLPGARQWFEEACKALDPAKMSPLGVRYGPGAHGQDHHGPPAFEHIQHLSLAGLWCSSDELLFFLRYHCPGLRHLTLQDIRLKEGAQRFGPMPCWAWFLEALRSKTMLETIDFRGDLSENHAPHARSWSCRLDRDQSVRDSVKRWFLSSDAAERCPLDDPELRFRLLDPIR